MIKILNIEIAADYLVMAAWLAFLKSKILIPDQHDDENSEKMDSDLKFINKELSEIDLLGQIEKFFGQIKGNPQ